MGLAQQWTYVFGRGFTGGPDFELAEGFRLDLDGIALEATLPPRNVEVGQAPEQLNFPFRSPGWFEKEQQQAANHFYVPVIGRSWAYLGPYWKVQNEPFGTLAFTVWIKRVLPGHSLVMGDPKTLGDAIHADYEEHFEAKEPGKFGRGSNTRTRLEVDKTYAAPHELSEEVKKLREISLKKRLREIPVQFEEHRQGDERWLLYRIEQEPNYPVRHYCRPLDQKYYLDVRFHYGIHHPRYFHLWQAHAEAAEQRIMSTVRLTFPR